MPRPVSGRRGELLGLSGERGSGEGEQGPGGPGGEEGGADGAAQGQQPEGGGGEESVLPQVGQRKGERDRGSRERPDGGRSGAGQERLDAGGVAETVEMAAAEEYEGEGGGEGDQGCQQSAADPGGGVADDGDGLHDRAGGDLPERHRVEELGAGHPAVGVDGALPQPRADAPAPAAAPITRRGGCAARNRAARARMRIRPGTMKHTPPTMAPSGPRSRQAHKMASWVEAGPGSRLVAAIPSSKSASVSHRRSCTHSLRSNAMWVGGPPKPMQPIPPHSRPIVPSLGCDAVSSAW